MTTGRAVAGAALVGYGWWATSLRPFSVVATLAVIGAGVVAIFWGLRNRVKRPHRRLRRDITGWALLAIALAGWQLAAYLQRPRSGHPTLSSIANTALDSQPTQTLAFVAWIFITATVAARCPER